MKKKIEDLEFKSKSSIRYIRRTRVSTGKKNRLLKFRSYNFNGSENSFCLLALIQSEIPTLIASISLVN